MAGIPISGLPLVTQCLLTDIIPEVQSSTTFKATLSQVLALFQASGLIPYTDVTFSPQQISPNNGYIANGVSPISLILPVLAAEGTRIEILGKGTGGWIINQNAGQNIQIGSLSSTVGTGGSVASSNQFDSLVLICISPNNTWACLGGPESSGLTII